MIRVSGYGKRGSDPVMRQTRGGQPMATSSLAIDVSRPGNAPEIEWFDLIAFGTVGEALANHSKGDLLAIMGRLTRSAFVDRTGAQRAGWSIAVEALQSVRGMRASTSSPKREAPRAH